MICPLLMPLYGQNKVIGSCAFEGFDHSIFGTLRHDPQAVSRKISGLMVAGIYTNMAGAQQMREPRSRNYLDIVCELHFASCFMINAGILDVLHQSSAAPHICGSTSAGLPGSSTPSQPVTNLAISCGDALPGMTTTSPPSDSIARTYCGRER